MFSRALLDIRYSARKFTRTPGVTLALLFTIAFGIGGNVSVYGFARGLTKSDSPLTFIGRVVSIFKRGAHRDSVPLSYRQYLRLKSHRNAFEWIGAARISPGTLTVANQSEIVSTAAITPDLTNALNLLLKNGVFISRRMWQNEFDSKANISGEQVRIDGINMRVSGVAPGWLEGLYRDRRIDIWMPLQEKTLHEADRRSPNFWVLARLLPGISTNRAQQAIAEGNDASDLIVLPYTGMEPEMAEGMSRIRTLLDLAAGMVFLIACANVASFLLGRTLARSHETSLRVALGAGRAQLAREQLWDSVVIGLAGGAFGVLLAVWTAHIVPALLFDQDTERLIFAPGLSGILAASAGCIAITIVCGLVPVFATRADQPATVLRRESAGASQLTGRLRMGLTVAQMASCCMLVVSTAFLLDGLHTALRTSTGHRLGEPVLATVQALPETGLRYFQQIQQAAQETSGLSGMAWTAQLPGTQPVWRSFRIDALPSRRREVALDIYWLTPGSLKFFTLPPSAGRLFGFEDRTCRVAIVNERAAAELFGDNTVGRIIQDDTSLPVEIIGVVKTKMSQAVKDVRPSIYYNHPDPTGPVPDPIRHARFHVPVSSELATAELDTNVVSPNYFGEMGLSQIAGQGFTSPPTPGECRVGMINQEAADLYFNSNPVGTGVIDDRGIRTTIIGVVHSKPLGVFQRHPEPTIYLPMSQDYARRMTLIAGARKITRPMLDDLRRRIEVVPGRARPPVVVITLARRLANTALAPLRIATLIMSASAIMALALSLLGLIGALSDSALRRRRELAIRIALGAQRWRVMYQVLREGGQLAGAGILIGTLGSMVLWRLLSRITPGNSSLSFWIWLAAPLALALAVIRASVLPARTALMANPLTIMRDDN